ncbi:AAA family ATPase [Pseudoalteromonas ardens]|uniref:AAA family ATPase n=1 Tax=Pseudoalteromonas ardens TaxID=3048490 RepID=UPI00067615B0|nr:ATP-binding protein [Pseudoalteromonas sp. R96]MDK1309796.1 ATP-binding protein [Pseudoalteromonas sp. R96]
MPVSVSTIKRAEAGKQVLGRTIQSLANYFQVSIDTLINDTDAPPWIYRHLVKDMPNPCYGRDWELNHLHSVLNLALNRCALQTLYLQGMTGAGKTSLLTTFATQLTTAGKRSLIFSCDASTENAQSPFSMPSFIKALMSVNDTTPSHDIRHKIDLIASSALCTLRLRQWLGNNLTQCETDTLTLLSQTRVKQLDKQVARNLLAYAHHKGVAVIVIDGAHNLPANALQFIQLFTSCDAQQAIAFIISAQQKHAFIHPPKWLSHAHTIILKPLDPDTMVQIANHTLLCQGKVPDKHREQTADAITRAQGNPYFLKQLLSDLDPVVTLPDALQHFARTCLNSMPCEVASTLKFAASLGLCFNTHQLQQFNDNEKIRAPLCVLHKMLCSGLVKQSDEHFCFVHPLVQEALKSQTTHSEFSWYTYPRHHHPNQCPNQVTSN